MRGDEASLVLVGDRGGVLTERDLVIAMAAGAPPETPARSFASQAPVAASAETSLGEAVMTMLDHGIRHLLVTDREGREVGVLSAREAARMLLHSLPSPYHRQEGEDAHGPQLEELGRQESLALLGTEHLGRLAVVAGTSFESARPDIFPVNYALAPDASIVVRTAEGAKLSSARLWWVAFEVDAVERLERRAWSVVVRGPAEEITDSLGPEAERLRQLPLVPWAPGPRDRWLRITPEAVSGRRIAPLPR